MNYQALLAAHAGRTVRAALVGAGQFGVSLLATCQRIPALDIAALADRDVERAVAACGQAGIDAGDVRICTSRAEAARALEAGQRPVVDDAALLTGLPLDVVVEATGDAEAGAVNAEAAIADGKHVAMVTKEADSVVGPLLAARAREAGLVYTPVDGDQPSLLIGLVSWSRALGLDVVAAGKSSEYDFVYHPGEECIEWRGRRVAVPGFESLWALAPGDLAGTLEGRAAALAELPQRTVPDLCEMGIVVNATDLPPDTPAFHLPVARSVEVPDVLCPREDGGILARRGVVDVFNALRRPDEASFAGGVFVVVACEDWPTWQVLRDKGIPVAGNTRYAMLYNPQHLLGIEAPISILLACLLGQSSGGTQMRPVCDLVARATRDFPAGEILAITDPHHHEVDGLAPMLIEAAPAAGASALPYYMATGRRLARAVPAGTVLAADMVEAPGASRLWELRAAQDARWFGD